MDDDDITILTSRPEPAEVGGVGKGSLSHMDGHARERPVFLGISPDPLLPVKAKVT